MAKFEIVSKYEKDNIKLPVRATANSAGYDFEVAQDILLDPYSHLMDIIRIQDKKNNNPVEAFLDIIENKEYTYKPYYLSEIANITKRTKAKPTLVPTGIKCKMANDEYLEISVRSSCPLKHWLILANGIGIIDSDYYNNPDNEGEIFFQIINLSPFPIQLKKGDKIGQGIIKKYIITEDDAAVGDRTGGFGSTSQN